MRARDLQGLVTRGGLEDDVTLGFENRAGQPADAGLVLDEENRLRTARRERRVLAEPGSRGRAGRARKINPERRTAARLAFDRDVSVALLHDAVSGREPETSPLALLLGREEGLEGVAPDFIAHADPRVGDRESRVFARACARVARGEAGVEHRISGLDREGAALGHGVPRVDREVYEHLLELAGEGSGALAGAVDLAERGPEILVVRKLRLHQLRVAEDGREEVVEVMRDAAREAPDPFHLLGNVELGLELLALRQVPRVDDQP